MMKKIVVLFSLFLICSQIQAMEKGLEQCSEEFFVPELQALICSFIYPHVLIDEQGKCVGIVPKKIERRVSKKQDNNKYEPEWDFFYKSNEESDEPHSVKISRTDGNEDLLVPLNLNPCQLVFENEKSNQYLFRIQCWKTEEKEDKHYIGLIGDFTDYRIDDDCNEQRVVAGDDSILKDHIFDGINDAGFVVFGGNEKFIKNQNYRYFIHRMTAANKTIYQQDIYTRNKINKKAYSHINESLKKNNYSSSSIEGIFYALALCKTANRFAIADNLGMTIFEMHDNFADCDLYEHKKKIIGSHQNDFFSTLTKLSFFRPNTLIGLSKNLGEKSGRLFVFSLNESDGSISYEKQTFRNIEGEVLIQDFAVDSCNPHSIILLTANKDVMYWDVQGSTKKLIKPIFKGMDVDSLWLYDNTLCLAKTLKKEVKIDSYQLISFDSKKLNKVTEGLDPLLNKINVGQMTQKG